jgi:hypothetical protein
MYVKLRVDGDVEIYHAYHQHEVKIKFNDYKDPKPVIVYDKARITELEAQMKKEGRL